MSNSEASTNRSLFNGELLLNMHIRMPNGNKVPLLITENTSIADLHVLVYAATNVPGHQQKLVYAGKVIKPPVEDDSSCTKEYGFKNGGTIYLIVQQPTPQQSSPTPMAPHKAPELPSAASPILDAMLSNSDMLHSMVMMDPRMRELSRTNPDMARMLRDPDFLKQMVHTSRNPAALREMQRTQDRALANLETIPGGYMALQRLYAQTSGAMDAVMSSPQMSLVEQERQSRMLATALNVRHVDARTLNTEPLPNPWVTPAPRPPPTPVLQQQPPSDDNYSSQLEHMMDMGFARVPSLRALRQAQGDLDAAVELMVVAGNSDSSGSGKSSSSSNVSSEKQGAGAD